MPITYATYSNFTDVYSIKGISQSEVESTWLPYGALRVNEALGRFYTTPFSDNNQTARDLSVHYGYLGYLLRTRKIDDSEELLGSLTRRITDITCGGAPMVLDDGTTLDQSNAPAFDSWSTHQNHKPTFDMRSPLDQRVDPDLIDDLWDQDA